MHRRKI